MQEKLNQHLCGSKSSLVDGSLSWGIFLLYEKELWTCWSFRTIRLGLDHVRLKIWTLYTHLCLDLFDLWARVCYLQNLNRFMYSQCFCYYSLTVGHRDLNLPTWQYSMPEKCWYLMPFRRRRRQRSWRWPPSWPRTTPTLKKVPLAFRLPLKNWLCPRCLKQTHPQKPLSPETKGLVQVFNTIFIMPIFHLNKGSNIAFKHVQVHILILGCNFFCQNRYEVPKESFTSKISWEKKRKVSFCFLLATLLFMENADLCLMEEDTG